MNNRLRARMKERRKFQHYMYPIIHDDNADETTHIFQLQFPDDDTIYDIYIKNHEDKENPHFHLTDNKYIDISIGIFDAKYIGDGKDNSYAELSLVNRKSLDKWMNLKRREDNKTNWEDCRLWWIIQNDDPVDTGEEYDMESRYPIIKPNYIELQ
jgi:hypothetical protein